MFKRFKLLVHEYAKTMRSSIRDHRSNPPSFTDISPTGRTIINNVRNRTGQEIYHATVLHGGKGRTGFPGTESPVLTFLKQWCASTMEAFSSRNWRPPRLDYPRQHTSGGYGAANARHGGLRYGPMQAPKPQCGKRSNATDVFRASGSRPRVRAKTNVCVLFGVNGHRFDACRVPTNK